MANLLQETKEILKDNGKTIEDIKWVGNGKYYADIEKFLELADNEYDDGYGSSEVACDLIVAGDNWWLERDEYDGSEWWEFKTTPKKPNKHMDLKNLFTWQVEEYYGWGLNDLNEVDSDDE